MTFWIIAILLILLALGMLLLPMLRISDDSETDQRREQNVQIAREKKQQLDQELERGEIDQSAYDAAYLDVQSALALELERMQTSQAQGQGRWMIAVIFLLLPAVSVVMYLQVGEYRVVKNPELAAARTQQPGAPQMTLDEMIITIQNRLREHPEDAEGWFALGRTMMITRDFDKAVAAFQRTADLVGDDAAVLIALADALAMHNDGDLAGEPEELIQRGLKLAPNYPNGLWLAGMSAEQRGDLAAAHAYWTRLLPLVQGNQESYTEVKTLLAQLEQTDPTLVSRKKASQESVQVGLRVDISPELRSRTKPEDTVFIFARASEGPPMPLAVRKIQLKDLPLSVTLSDEDAMLPSMKLSSFERVILGARVSFSGKPVAQPGDFFAESGALERSGLTDEINLVIDQIK
ncbi:MAG: c-type cytochrome biogenesis protein CcmI [Pseudomonadota bacterium]